MTNIVENSRPAAGGPYGHKIATYTYSQKIAKKVTNIVVTYFRHFLILGPKYGHFSGSKMIKNGPILFKKLMHNTIPALGT